VRFLDLPAKARGFEMTRQFQEDFNGIISQSAFHIQASDYKSLQNFSAC
jgi:hypothetical protein